MIRLGGFEVYCIYKITNLVNGKTYIGQHKYKTLGDSYMGSGKLLQKAYSKYGIENFKKEILVFNISRKEHIDLLEKTFIASEREKVGVENCYNIAEGGSWGSPNKGKPSWNKGKSSWNKGKHHSEKTKKKISKANKGRHHSDEAKRKISESSKGRSAYWKGKHLSIETKNKISKSHIGKKQSEETKKKRSKSLKGRVFSEDWKRKLSEADKGKNTWTKEQHWYNNGTKNIRAKTCPEGFVPGRLKWR